MEEFKKNLRTTTLERLDHLDAYIDKDVADHPVIGRLLNLPEQQLYELTKCYKNNLNSVEGLIHSLRHAFVDDGDWSIVRKVDTSLLAFFEEAGIPEGDRGEKFTYEIREGDWTLTQGVQAILILEEDWDVIIDTHMLHVEYYSANRDAVDGWEDEANEKYWELLNKSDELYARWFEERKGYWQ